MSIFNKQYLLTSCNLDIQGMQEIQVLRNRHLYVGKDLKVKTIAQDGNESVVLGNVFSGEIMGKSIEDDLKGKQESLREAAWHWTGRWLLFDDGELITDACGLMAAFYYQDEKGWYISSSLAVLQKVLELKRIGKVNQTGLTWAIIPNTIVEGVRKLLPTQKIIFKGNTIDIFFDNWIKDQRALETEQKCEKITTSLCNAIANLHNETKAPIYLTLTGGKDCRLVFACVHKAKVPVHCFTFEHSNLPKCDRVIPKQIAEKYNQPYRFVRSKPFLQNLYDEYCDFCDYNSLGADAEFYAKGVYHQLPQGAVMLKGGLFEAGQTYSRSFMQNTLEGVKKGFESYYGPYLKNDFAKESWDEYCDYIQAYPIPWLDLRDRLYLEQRCGAWVAAIEQSLDITGVTSIQVANSAEIISTLLSATEEERKNKAFSMALIKYVEPSLLDFPINPLYLSDKIRIINNAIKKRLFRK